MASMARDHPAVSPVQMIQIKRRNARPHTSAEIASFIAAYTHGQVPDYQMSAWLMAICIHHDSYHRNHATIPSSPSEASRILCRPAMTLEETAALTRAMVASGKQLQWPSTERRPLVDKHSTGGVGDKVSILLAPLVASLGVGVPMMAGRGLGHTGGTIDKLESIPGFRCDLTAAEFQAQVLQGVGCAITATTPEVCPADRKLYALRDVTDTVACPALQTASILSKKIAEHPDSLVLDVKYGSGGFQATVDDAVALAESMVHAGEANGLTPTVAYVTNMEGPLGQCIGNWWEVQECFDILSGKWKELHRDLILLTLVLAGQMIHQAGLCTTLDKGIDQALVELRSLRPLQKFLDLVQAQGGRWTEVPHDVPIRYSVPATRTGYIRRVDAGRLGQICAQTLGAGRSVAGAPVDPLAGLVLQVRVGDFVDAKDVLWDVYCCESISMAVLEGEAWEDAVEYSDEPILEIAPIITHRVTSTHGAQPYTIPEGLRNQVDAGIQCGPMNPI